MWLYGIQPWGCASENNTEVKQRFQNKLLRAVVIAPWYAIISELHRDLTVEMVVNEIRNSVLKHEVRLQDQIK